jgi:hypothetical protein
MPDIHRQHRRRRFRRPPSELSRNDNVCRASVASLIFFRPNLKPAFGLDLISSPPFLPTCLKGSIFLFLQAVQNTMFQRSRYSEYLPFVVQLQSPESLNHPSPRKFLACEIPHLNTQYLIAHATAPINTFRSLLRNARN